MADIAQFPVLSDSDLPDRMTAEDAYANRFTEQTLERHKREGLEMAVRARWIALAIIGLLLPYLNPSWEMLYYEGLLVILAGVGWLQRRYGRVGRSRAELALLAVDVAVMVFALTFPNPFGASEAWPDMMVYRFESFIFLFVILALGTLSYSWRTIFAIGSWACLAWLIAFFLMWKFGMRSPELGEAAFSAFGHDASLLEILDPNSLRFDLRVQQVVVFMIVAGILAMTVRRFNRLLLSNAGLERERANLSRYFSPNVVDELSHNDEPLKQIKSHDVAVMFVDIQGFTGFAANRTPEQVISTLREFHAQMERAVFHHDGTLDKYLGDGLMATFGTPMPKEDDVMRAYRCAEDMLRISDAWNAEREVRGEPTLRVSIGIHHGPVVLGDIGGSRLEFAVIGNTVNVASRLEAMTRPLGGRLIVSEAVHQALPAWLVAQLQPQNDQEIRGLDGRHCVWMLP